MSGLVRTYSAWSRAQSRCSRRLSPSWVVTRTSSPSAAEPGELVLGERLGRREVEHGRAALVARAACGADRGQRGQLVGQALAGGGAGREHDVLALVGGLGGDRLVLPRALDPAGPERRDHVGVGPGRPVGVRRRRARGAPRGGAAGPRGRARRRAGRPRRARSRGRDPRADVTTSLSSTAPTSAPRPAAGTQDVPVHKSSRFCARDGAGVVSLCRPDVGFHADD